MSPPLLLGLGLAGIVIVVALTWPSGVREDSGLVINEPRADEAAGSDGTVATPFAAHRAHVVGPMARAEAKLHGKIRWDFGGAVADAEVALLDASGEVIAEATTSGDGSYELTVMGLGGAELQVTEPLGTAHQRDLRPFIAGEDRAFDVVLGEQREVVGWVLDAAGDPQPGVFVTATWEAAEARWTAITDRGGGFTFVDVPVTPLRVTADGGDLGVASARVARTDATRREVTLVLEPTGTITVRGAPELEKLGRVVINCYSSAAHGEDGMWSDDLRPIEAPAFEEVDPAMTEPPFEEEPSPDMQELEAMFGNALREWDQADPNGSLVRMALSLATSHPHMEMEIRRDAEREFPELAGASLEAIAQAAVDKIIAEEPRVLEMMGLAALKLQEGASPMEALMMAENEARAQETKAAEEPMAEAYAEPAIEPVGEEVELAEPLEPEVAEYDLGEDYVDNSDQLDQLEAIREQTGIDAVSFTDSVMRSVVATGRFHEPIPVRGAFEYTVAIRTDDDIEITCGTVFVAAGEDVVVDCGGQAVAAIFEGRVVDAHGAPVEGAVVEAYIDGPTEARTDRLGRYTLEVPIAMAQLITISAHDSQVEDWRAERRQQNARPGQVTEVPDLILRRGDEIPTHAIAGPFGGVGANIGLGSEGIVLQGLFEDGPLAMAGADAGDVIIRIGDQLGASLSVDDALSMLRGEAGSDVDLTLRSAAGELYELLVTRGTITPPSYEEGDLDSIE